MTLESDSTATGWFLSGTAQSPAPDSLSRETGTRVSARHENRGRTRILPRALRQIVSMVTAESLGVLPNDVAVDLDDDHGMLLLNISTPIRVVSLAQVSREPAAVDLSGGTILARSQSSQTEIRRRVGELTGSDIGRVSVRLTSVKISSERQLR